MVQIPLLLLVAVVLGLATAQQTNEFAGAPLNGNTFTPLRDDDLRQAVLMWDQDDKMAKDVYGDIETWNTTFITNFRGLFADTQSSFKYDLNAWDVSRILSFHGLAQNAPNFQADISAWDTSKVIDMSQMFAGALAFQGDLSRWNTRNTVSLMYAFDGAESFNADLSKWNTSSCQTTMAMFQGTRAAYYSIYVLGCNSLFLPHIH